jgi:hypothetical protein
LELLAVTDRAIAIAQIVISIVFLVGYFWLLGQFITGKARVDPEYKDIVNSLLSVLTAGVGAVIYFWFQRSRQNHAQSS